jgi:hypothetical protein
VVVPITTGPARQPKTAVIRPGIESGADSDSKRRERRKYVTCKIFDKENSVPDVSNRSSVKHRPQNITQIAAHSIYYAASKMQKYIPADSDFIPQLVRRPTTCDQRKPYIVRK